MYGRIARGSIPLFGAFEENSVPGFAGVDCLKQEMKDVTLWADITVFLGCDRGDE